MKKINSMCNIFYGIKTSLILFPISIAILTLPLSSCEKEVDFKYNEIPPIPVIEAQLTSEGARASITYTTPMNEPMDLQRYTDAEIFINDMTLNTTYRMSANPEGYFISSSPGIPGHEYKLEVKRNGLCYTTMTTMYPSVEILSTEFNWISMPYDDVAVLQCRYTDNPDIDGEHYWVKVYRNGEIYMWAEQSDKTAENGIMNFFAMTSRRDLDKEDDKTALKEGDIITVTVCGISRVMHDYLEALGNDSSGPRLFTTTISSDNYIPQKENSLNNLLSIGCLGYFIATSPESDTIVFHPDDIPMASDK